MPSATLGYKPTEMEDSTIHFTLLVVFSCLAIIAVILRLWARKIQTKAFSISDYLIVLGLVSFREKRSRIGFGSLMMVNARCSHSPRPVLVSMVNLPSPRRMV